MVIFHGGGIDWATLRRGWSYTVKIKKIEIDETNVCEAREREREGEWEKKSVGGARP